MSSNSRRDFIKIAAGLAGLALLMPKSVLAEGGRGGAAPAGGDLPLVEPGKGMAVGVNYVAKNSDVKDAKLKVDRAGVPFAKQTCAGCALYTAAGKKGGADVGKCAIFANQLVKGEGWCSSWSKKA